MWPPNKSAPFIPGSDTSRAAAESIQGDLGNLEAVVLAHIRAMGSSGATDDEVEVECDLSHQTASARRRGLVQKGLVKDSGARRETRSGRQAVVWVLGTEDRVQAGPDQPIRVAMPGPDVMMAAIREIKHLAAIGRQQGHEPAHELQALGRWLITLVGT